MRSNLFPRGLLSVAVAAILVVSSTGVTIAQQSQDHSGMSHGGGHGAPVPSEGGMPMADGDNGGHTGHDMQAMDAMGAMASNVHEIHLAATQPVIAHRSTIHALLVALDIDPARNLELLDEAREHFSQVQSGLGTGDAQHGLDGSDHSSVRRSLQEVNLSWTRYDAVIQQIVAQPPLSAAQLTMLEIANADLHNALRNMIETTELNSYGGRGHSILLPTVRHAQLLSATLQELAAGYLALASGHRSAGAYREMRDSAAEFDTVLDALLNGDHELRVLGAPTPELREQYSRVRLHWLDCWAAIEVMSASPSADPEMIASVLARVDQVASEVDAAVALYHGL